MYIEPWVRFAMRIRPKISEKPAASRKSRPPRARLFRVWMIQYCINARGRKNPAPLFALRGSRLQVLGGRPIARIHRVLQELFRLVGPELAHVRVGMDDAVHEAPVLAFDLADVNAADHVSVFVECNRPPGGLDLDAAHRLHESRLVLDVSLDRVQGPF